MKHIWHGSLLSSIGFVVVIFALMVTIAMYGDGEGAGKTYLLLRFSHIIFPSLLLVLWLASGSILKLSAMLVDGKRPVRFALSSVAIAAVIGMLADLLFSKGDVLFVISLSIVVSVSAAAVLFLNRRSANASMWEILQAKNRKDVEEAKALLEEYTASLGINLDFQHFDRELQHFPGHYASPDGRVLLAKSGNQVAGCVCLRRLAGDVCEMKRLYVKPEYRGLAIGKQLALVVIHEAKTIGYHRMRLDTLPTMSAAKALYTTLGFKRTEPYYDNPLEGAMFFELKL